MPCDAEKRRFHLPDPRFLVLFAVLAAMVGISIWKTGKTSPRTRCLTETPVGIMGTECTLTVYVRPEDEPRGRQLLTDAEHVLRQCESLTSTWLEDSELSRFNRAGSGEKVALSPFTEAFFRRSRQAWEETGGIFDITCGAVWQCWHEASKTGQAPGEQEILAARDASRWEFIHLENGAVTKTVDSVRVVSGGVAKGMAIDAAMRCLRDACVLAAIVDVGGDISVFRREDFRRPVTVLVRSVRGDAPAAAYPFHGEAAGICTSGNYARFFMVDGRKYSQIIHPLTGRPAEGPASVTVMAPDTATADIWSTAVSILGEAGLEKLPPTVKLLEMEGAAAGR